jgi:hypothetical protein
MLFGAGSLARQPEMNSGLISKMRPFCQCAFSGRFKLKLTGVIPTARVSRRPPAFSRWLRTAGRWDLTAPDLPRTYCGFCGFEGGGFGAGLGLLLYPEGLFPNGELLPMAG